MNVKIFIITAVVLILAGCFSSCYPEEELRKDEEPCVTRIIQDSPSTTVLSKSDMDEIKRLFIANQLDESQDESSPKSDFCHKEHEGHTKIINNQ